MAKRGLCLLLAVILTVSLSGCEKIAGGAFFLFLVILSDDSAEKGEVFAFVRENEAELMAAIEAGDFSAYENQGFIKDIDAQKAVVDFSCGGAGIGSGTSYVGFYYTQNHSMTAVWCAPYHSRLLKPSGNGFVWQEQGRDNRYYTEHICGKFYYYEASF